MELKKAILAISVTLLFSCVSTNVRTNGTDFDLNLVSKLKKGVTTKEEVINILGEPTSRERDGEKEKYKYYYYKAEGRMQSYIIAIATSVNRYEKLLDISFKNDLVSDIFWVEGPKPIDDYDAYFTFDDFAVKAPQNPKWFILFISDRNISFNRSTGKENHTIIALANSFVSDEHINNADDLERVVRRKALDGKDDRYKNVKMDVKRTTIEGLAAIEIDATASDYKNPKDPDRVYLLHVLGIYIKHPTKEDHVIHVGYSQRLPEGKNLIDVKGELAPFIGSFRIVDSKL